MPPHLLKNNINETQNTKNNNQSMKYLLMQIYYTYKILHEMEQHYPNNGFNENKYNPVRSRTYPENLPVCGIFCI